MWAIGFVVALMVAWLYVAYTFTLHDDIWVPAAWSRLTEKPPFVTIITDKRLLAMEGADTHDVERVHGVVRMRLSERWFVVVGRVPDSLAYYITPPGWKASCARLYLSGLWRVGISLRRTAGWMEAGKRLVIRT